MVSGPVWPSYQPSHNRMGLGHAPLSEAVCPAESEFDQSLLGGSGKLTPVGPITDTKSKLPEVGSDKACQDCRVKQG